MTLLTILVIAACFASVYVAFMLPIWDAKHRRRR